MTKTHNIIHIIIFIVAASSILLFAGISLSATLSKSPVVENLTDVSAKIKLTTDTDAGVQVLYSQNNSLADGVLTPTNPAVASADNNYTVRIPLTDLLPETRYYYSVVIDGVKQSTTYKFRTRYFLSLRPLVGGVTDKKAVIYARSTDRSAELQVLYGLKSDLSDGALAPNPPLITSADDDFVGQISLTDLTAETQYYFLVLVDGRQSKIYNFKTFPAATSVKNFRFAVFSDSENTKNKTPVFKTVLNDKPEFILQIGDYLHKNPGYDTSSTISKWWRNDFRALSSSWYKFDDTATTSLPFIHIWDDHDYGNNNADKTAWFRSIATAAFRDYFPTYELPNPDGGNWQKARYAQTEFFILDLRSQRDPYLDKDNGDKSMLDGDLIVNDQKSWLKQALLESTAKWKFIISSVPWNPKVLKKESWHGFQTEQKELVDFIKSNNISGVVFFSGDIHSAGAIDNGTNAYFPEVAVPHTDLGTNDRCTGDRTCGTWSEGIVPLSEVIGGYLLVDVVGQDSVTFTIKEYYGTVKKTYTL